MVWLHLAALNLVALHLGSLHPVEKVLTFVLAFGPFLALAVVWFVRRGQDDHPQDQRER